MSADPLPSAPASAEDVFRYGWRFVPRPQPDGGVELEQVPLTLEDVLHPQEGDVIPERPIHEIDRRYLASVLQARPVGPPIVHVASDQLIDWGVPDLRHHAPDIVVFAGLREQPDLNQGIFDLADSGGRCLLVVEVVSPHTRANDIVHKPDHYYRAGVPLYVIVDQERERGPRQLRGYRHTPAGYEPMTVDERGWLRLDPLGLALALGEERVVCYEVRTGKELGDYTRISRELEEADRQIDGLKQDLEDSTLRERTERIAREKAEERGRAETQAREEAQRLARDEAKAREEAQRLARDEAKAREAAEQRVRDLATARETAEEARKTAETRILELEAALQRLQDAGPSTGST